MPDGPSSTGPRGWSQQRDIQLLSTARGVLRVTPVRLVPAPRAWNGLEQVASVSTGSSSSNIRRSNLDMIGVTSLHEEGVNGKGVKIAMIDTGVDWTHPSLGAGFGPGG
jgi:subtilisin family serine protease